MLAVSTSLPKDRASVLESAFNAAYRDHADEVYRLCLRYSGGRTGWAEDAAHDTFVRLLEMLPRLRDPRGLGGWLYRVATNVCVSKLRRERSVLGRLQRWYQPPEVPTLEAYLELKESAQAALEALRKLPPREHAAMSMKLFDGRSQRDIAKTLKLSESYVSKLIQRASAKLEAAGWELGKDAD